MALRAAIVGCGRMAGTIDDEVRDHPGMLFPYGHAGAYLAAPGVELVAAADPDGARREAFCDRFGIPGRFADYGDMVDAVRPDIVSVTTPATARAGVLLGLAARGVRAVYAEKAFACSLAEADAAAAALRRAGTALNIGTSRRFHPAYRAARELQAGGAIGAPRLAVAHAAGALLHTHSHTLDTLLFLLGDPEVEEVQGRLGTAVDLVGDRRFPGDPALEWAVLRCRGGTRAALFSVPGRYEFEMVGAAGAIGAHNNGHAATWTVRRPGALRQGGLAVWETEAFPAFDASVSPTLRAVLELAAAVGDPGTPTSGGLEVALRQMEVAMAIAESHLAGGAPVALPLPRRDLYIPSR